MLNHYPELQERSQNPVIMQTRQEPLCQRYAHEPGAGRVIDSARTSSSNVQPSYPLGSAVRFCDDSPVIIPVGVHTAVGGESDYPTPGDILCGAIASCLDSTLRVIANRLSVSLLTLDVEVLGSVDVRGTLLVDQSVPVGFTRFDISVAMSTDDATPDQILDSVLTAAEHSCVVLQTLGDGPEIVITRK